MRVVVPAGPPEAAQLMFCRWNWRIGGHPLASQGVTLVMQRGADEVGAEVAPVGERLRVLGLFSCRSGGGR